MLKKHPKFPGIKGPSVIVVMDGIGISQNHHGNAFHHAHTPVLDGLFSKYPHTLLKAHGTAVGMPSDSDMGNSEVGHNTIGAGQVYSQGAALVSKAIASGRLFEGDAWREVIGNVRKHASTLHFMGLLSDGNVHSHIDHLKSLVLDAKKQKVGKVRVHILLDGRDVPQTSALEYIEELEQLLAQLRDSEFDARIASGGGRMNITMDRYEADWGMVEKGWHTHVLGDADYFDSAKRAVQILRHEGSGDVIDQYLPPFVIVEDGEPVGPIVDGDSVVLFNFRGDRAIEISRAFEEEDFIYFDRVRHPDVVFAGMLQYDGDLEIPNRFLVAPPVILHTMGEYLANTGVTQLAVSETQKFGHVTYFWNGNRSAKFSDELETYMEIPSDICQFQERPWMKSAEVTDVAIRQLKTGKYRTARVNFANGDMVGHTGHYEATMLAIEAVDLALKRLLPVVDALGGVVIITADHGNVEEMYELDKITKLPVTTHDGGYKAKTCHTLNPVPCIFYNNQTDGSVVLKDNASFGLSNLAATNVNFLGYEAPQMWDEGMLEFF